MSGLKNYRQDSFVTGLAIKAPVQVATTANITLSGEQTVNTVALVEGDRVLVKDQTDPIENGIWVVETSAWQRAGDWDGSRDVVIGTLIPVYRPSDGKFPLWQVTSTSPSPVRPGTTAVTFEQYFSPGISDLPLGTTGGSTLYWSGSDWIENTRMRETATDFRVYEATETDYLSFTHSGLTSFIANNNTAHALNIDGGDDIEYEADTSHVWKIGVNTAMTIDTARVLLSAGTDLRINDDIDTDWMEFVMNTDLATVNFSTGTSRFRLADGVTLQLNEIASAPADTAAYGQFWVRSDTPNVPVFTDDAGTDQDLDPSYSEMNVQNGNYTLVLGDKGKTISKESGGVGETFTIPANSSVAFPVGTFVGFNNDGGGDLTIAITTDTLTYAVDNTTGNRTLADGGYAVVHKTSTTGWKIVGQGLS